MFCGLYWLRMLSFSYFSYPSWTKKTRKHIKQEMLRLEKDTHALYMKKENSKEELVLYQKKFIELCRARKMYTT